MYCNFSLIRTRFGTGLGGIYKKKRWAGCIGAKDIPTGTVKRLFSGVKSAICFKGVWNHDTSTALHGRVARLAFLIFIDFCEDKWRLLAFGSSHDATTHVGLVDEQRALNNRIKQS